MVAGAGICHNYGLSYLTFLECQQKNKNYLECLMIHYLNAFYELIFTQHTLLFFTLLSCFCKLFILIGCIRFSFKTDKHRMLLVFLVAFLFISLLNDVGNIIYIVKRVILGITENIEPITFLSRIVWGLMVTQYQAIALFMEYLLYKRIRFGFFHFVHALINLGISSIFFYHAFFKYTTPCADPSTLPISVELQKAVYMYVPALFIPLFYKVFKRKSNTREVPNILVHQLRYLTGFTIPYLLCDMFGNCSFLFTLIPAIAPYKYSFDAVFFSLSAMLSTYPIFFVSRRLLDLRFLNNRNDVESKEKFNFLSQFKDILEQLSYATALKELAHLNQTFFLAAFKIPLGRTRLFIRKTEPDKDNHGYYDIINISTKVEQFISKADNQEALEILKDTKIYIRDEIEFSHFYDGDKASKDILAFLDLINADIFLPIFERNTVVAYSIIERNARPNQLYTNKDRDEMLVFTSYLSNIINILKYSNMDALHHHQKELTEELYHKHQEINQCKESIRSFMRAGKERKIGIIFYKHRRFTFANETAQELTGMDLNMNLGHSLTIACKGVARKVQEYKTPQQAFALDAQGKRIVIAGIPGLEAYATILLLYYPEISDIIKTQIDQLKDPSAWDYILYLETTQAGQLINQLIPAAGEKLLNFKVQLLSVALSKKTTVLDMPEDDLLPTVELLHHISLRQTIHTLKISVPEKSDEVAVKLFGLNPLIKKESTEPLLQSLNDTGTLFIQQIENLHIDTQEQLAEYLLYGYFHPCKSDHKIFSNVRIICSSTKNLFELVNEGRFSKTLYNELAESHIVFPSLHTFSDAEINELAQGIVEHIETTQTYKNLLALTEKDKQRLCIDRPLSLRGFKEKVHQLLVAKSTKHNIADTTTFDTAYQVTEPDIAHAVRLGKKALKDPQIMAILWSKFKNQNKIATLLGVNRSSVNRRCQLYNIK